MYGFVADPNLTNKHNAYLYLSHMPAWFYFSRLTNTAFHDLTSFLKPPSNLKSLLGLGAKFIPTPRHSHNKHFLTKDTDSPLPQFRRDLHLRCHFASDDPSTPENDTTYNPKMYVQSKWTPPPWTLPFVVKERIQNFEHRITNLFNKRRGHNNLLPHQRYLLSWLQQQDDFIIAQCDKNLGPAIIEKTRYCQLALQHLQHTGVYRRLSKFEAIQWDRTIRRQLTNWMKNYSSDGSNVITTNELKFLQTELKQVNPNDPFATFYLLMKVHKTPLQVRPVVSYPGSLCHAIGIWCDSHLQKIAQQQCSYIKNSFELKQKLAELQIPPNAKLFTCDATAMYTNIPTEPAIHIITTMINTHFQHLHLPNDAIISALKLIMRNNIFTFGDTFWKQVNGLAMGASPSPTVATLFFAPHEDTLCQRFNQELFYYSRYIDDGFGIWLTNTHNNHLWPEFKRQFNDYHGLNWTFSDLSNTVNFLDMTISIKDQTLTFSLFEKELNHHLYIPPHSSHPPGIALGLIHGLIFRIATICSNDDDKRRRINESFQHLLQRGYNRDSLLPIFKRALRHSLTYKGSDRQQPSPTRDMVLFRLPYHPQDPPSYNIQQAWRETIANPPYKRSIANTTNTEGVRLGINRMIVCYRRPMNLQNLLSIRKFAFKQGPPVSSYLD